MRFNNNRQWLSKLYPADLFEKHSEVKMTVTTLKATVLGNLLKKKDFLNKECWRIWAKKINGEWSPDSPAVVALFSPPGDGFHMVGECWNINDFKDKYLANGQTLEQFADNWLASLNAAETVSFEVFQKIRESHLSRKTVKNMERTNEHN